MDNQQKIIDELNKMDYVILCPSRSRAKKVLTKKFIPDIVLVVNQDQKEEYEKYNPNNIVLSPPSHIRGITPTRAWILENFKNLFMIDDDVIEVRKNYQEIGEISSIEDQELIRSIIDYSFYVARLIGAKMFGFSPIVSPLLYNAHTPFGFTGFFNGSYVGFIEGHGLSYSPEFDQSEDYYISLLNAHKNRFGFIDRRFTFITKDNFRGSGGCAEYRTTEIMRKNSLLLRQTFGEVVKLKKPNHGKIHVHDGERSISIPF